MVSKLEISVKRKYLRWIFRNIKLYKLGAIEFEKFYIFANKKSQACPKTLIPLLNSIYFLLLNLYLQGEYMLKQSGQNLV